MRSTIGDFLGRQDDAAGMALSPVAKARRRLVNLPDTISEGRSVIEAGPGSASLDAEQSLSRIASQLDAKARQDGLHRTLIGIHRGGAWVARRLHDMLCATNQQGFAQRPGFLSSVYHRDDYGHNAQRRALSAKVAGTTELPFEVNGSCIVLIDDVLYTGRTIRAALNELFDYGRPAKVELAILLDRGGRELPIQADFSGGTVALASRQAALLSQDEGGVLSFSIVER